jgi:cation-transporting ATPase I
MSLASELEPSLVHALPGRIRLHLPAWSGQRLQMIEARLQRLPGVRRAQANALTGNVLIYYDPARTDEKTLRQLVIDVQPVPAVAPARGNVLPRDQGESRKRPPSGKLRTGGTQRARIPTRGLVGNSQLGRCAVERLERYASVRARPDPLTGRILVEFDAAQVSLEKLGAEIKALEPPQRANEHAPAHPLDPGPLCQSTLRTAAACLGLAVLAFRRLIGSQTRLPGAPTARSVSAVINLIQAYPFVRHGVRALLGQDTGEAIVSLVGITAQTISGGPIGLVLAGSMALRLLTVVLPRRRAWYRYEEILEAGPPVYPGARLTCAAGERSPLDGIVLEGAGMILGRDALPFPLAPGSGVSAGDRFLSGPFLLKLEEGSPVAASPRPAPPVSSVGAPYRRVYTLLSFAYAALRLAVTGSPRQGFVGLLLVNPRTAVLGADAANENTAARVLRSGVTIVETDPHRSIRRPTVLLLDSPRLVTDGLELGGVLPLAEGYEVSEILSLAGGISAETGSPWGNVFPMAGSAPASNGSFDGTAATALIGGTRFGLRPAEAPEIMAAGERQDHAGEYLLLLENQSAGTPLAILLLRPRLATGLADLVAVCRRHRVKCLLLSGGTGSAGQAIGRRAGISFLDADDAIPIIRQEQRRGGLVALVSDRVGAGAAFAACDLGIGLSSGRSGPLLARTDLMAPDLTAVAAIIEAGAGREAIVRATAVLAIADDLFGAVWGFRGQPTVDDATRPGSISALTAFALAWLRQRGGERAKSALDYLIDPRPERWGRQDVADVLRAMDTTAMGLPCVEAARRQRRRPQSGVRSELLEAVVEQLRSPVNAILGWGAGLALLLGGRPYEVVVIGAIMGVNVAIEAWQQRQAGLAAEALRQLSSPVARVLRDGESVTVPADELVPGDILLLAAGERVTADARLLDGSSLQVDEASLTGESEPVHKTAEARLPENRILLDGSDVVSGSGRAVVVAVGRATRLGAIAAALRMEETEQSPLSTQLARILHRAVPVAVLGGAVVVVSGLLRRQPLLPQLATGVSIAVAVVPESLPLLAGVGQVGVARRLARHNALVRRLSAIETLGRVDIACTDKTGTLTEGRLALQLVANSGGEVSIPGVRRPEFRRILLGGAFATPHPDVVHAADDPTDVAIMQAAHAAGLGGALQAARGPEAPFDAVRAFHAAVVRGKLWVKGAPETVLPRCERIRHLRTTEPIDESGRQALLEQAASLAARGLRVLAVAEGARDLPPEAPHHLTALGFLGIRDPLRPGARDAVRRCRQAGVRVLMITGDHPGTACAIGREAGILGGQAILTGAEIATLTDEALRKRLEKVTVVARATPFDKMRIVQSLQQLGLVVAMTGDGVNDAPALRLADVGVAMGKGGTEVARHAADLVLADDNFATLVEALVEGRGFWGNLRRAVGCLLGGNVGEFGLIVGASGFGFATPLGPAQILTVNLITDALPNFAVVLQQPEHRDLAALAREGTGALEETLRREVLRRGLATALPTLVTYLLSLRLGGPAQATTVAFGSVVTAELAQTAGVGWAEGQLSRSVLGALAGSFGVLTAAVTVPGLRSVLGLALPSPLSVLLVVSSAAAAVGINRGARRVGNLLPGPVRGRAEIPEEIGSGRSIPPDALGQLAAPGGSANRR